MSELTITDYTCSACGDNLNFLDRLFDFNHDIICERWGCLSCSELVGDDIHVNPDTDEILD